MTLQDNIRLLTMLLAEYAYLVSNLPIELFKSRPYIPVRARAVLVDEGSQTESDEDLSFKSVEINTNQAVIDNIEDDDVSAFLAYDMITNTWAFTYYPVNDLGIEVMGTSLDKVIELAIVSIGNRIKYVRGEVDGFATELEHEFMAYIVRQEEEEQNAES